jgi:hypothetical protein
MMMDDFHPLWIRRLSGGEIILDTQTPRRFSLKIANLAMTLI